MLYLIAYEALPIRSKQAGNDNYKLIEFKISAICTNKFSML